MATNEQTKKQQTPALVRPGERAVLLSLHEYELARALGQGLGNYDLLMRRPDDEDSDASDQSDDKRWVAVRADKYLKHRATGWREAESIEELPENWRTELKDRNPFPPAAADAQSEGSA